MMPARPVRSIVVLVALVLTACGGGEQPTATEEGQAAPAGQAAPGEDEAAPAEEPVPQDDEGAVREVVVTYFTALADRDHATACQQLSPEAQQDVTNLAQAGGSCEEAMAAAFAAYRGKDLATLDDVQITSVEITGDSAVVAIQGGTKPVPLTRVGGVWRISQLVAG
jgi:hypothetical protein